MAVGRASRQRGAIAGCAILAALPDVDLALYLRDHVHTTTAFSHRGFTHSIGAAILCGLVAWAVARAFRARAPSRVALFVTLAVASHGVIDLLSDRGGAVAWLWPLSDARIVSPLRPLPVARFHPFWQFVRTELVEILAFAPCLLYALWPRRRHAG
jgi:inner membrane protein